MTRILIRATTIAVRTDTGTRRILDQPYCWCCPPVIAAFQREGWPSFAGTRFRPRLHHGQ